MKAGWRGEREGEKGIMNDETVIKVGLFFVFCV